ncbi:MAG: hypothetical protein ATN35_02965 [Epulopiscium sp. Nele67-Bin004]|nr:MAG: hypothetical protein ATN35_02965 [Epulopiscium sp. Nele67-Bin004]
MNTQQKLIYDKLLEVTKQQAQYLDAEDTSRFERLLDKRERFIKKLVKMGDELDKTNPELNVIRDEIIALHASNVSRYEEMFDEAKDDLQLLRKQKQFNNAYTNPYSKYAEEGFYFDKRNNKM